MKPPTATPAMAPVGKELPECEGMTLYCTEKSWVLITETSGLDVASGGTSGRIGVVTQGVAPAISEVCRV